MFRDDEVKFGVMPISLRGPRGSAAFLCTLVAIFFAAGAQAAVTKRVLLLHSFGREIAPFDTTAAVFRTDLAKRSPGPIAFTEANLDFARSVNEDERMAFLAYMRARFAGSPPDAVVTIGGPAARFYLEHRADLFPGTPVVIGAIDERVVQQLPLQAPDKVVAVRTRIPQLMENILTLLPETQTVALVVGASDLERYWLGEAKRELAPFADRVRLEWLNGLSLVQMQERVAHLPAHSAILYLILVTDAAGVPHERLSALASLHAVANAPIFGLYEAELGSGVVGGPYMSQSKAGERLATAVLDALGTPDGAVPRIDVSGFDSPVYDWRELDRWRIDPARLPAGSETRYRPPTAFEDHRTAIVLTAAILLVQAALITGLLVQRHRRRRAEQEARHLGGRILTAQEDERRRLAREMHDDVTQRLAVLAIDAGVMQGTGDPTSKREALETIRERLVGLSEDVHALSYRLHPSVIEDLGLVAALKVECNRVARQEPIVVEFESDGIPKKVPMNAATCLFRIAQEALRNVIRHARAAEVRVTLRPRDGGLELAIRDDGQGFTDPEGDRTSLGLVSMRERVRLVGGALDLTSQPGVGTAVVAWVPLQGAA